MKRMNSSAKRSSSECLPRSFSVRCEGVQTGDLQCPLFTHVGRSSWRRRHPKRTSGKRPIAAVPHLGELARMKQKTEAEVVAEVRRHTTGNRHEIEASKFAGCASCCARFDANEITEWQDEWHGSEKQSRGRRWTAKCPRCGQPNVIGSSTGLLDDQAYEPVVKLILERAATPRT